MLVLCSNLRVIKEVVQISEGLAFLSSLQEVGVGVVSESLLVDCEIKVTCKALFQLFDVDEPNVDSEVVAAGRHEVLSVGGRADVNDFPRVRDDSHRVVGVAFQRKLDQSHDFVLSAVGQVVFRHLLLQLLWLQNEDFVYWTGVGRAEASLFANFEMRSTSLVIGVVEVSELELVVVVASQQDVFLAHVHGVPDAGSGGAFLLNLQ